VTNVWGNKQIALGNCAVCGEVRDGENSRYCSSCYSKVRDRAKKRVALLKRLGLCILCKRKLNIYAVHCDACQKKENKRARRRREGP
jgi:hypothetical protein